MADASDWPVTEGPWVEVKIPDDSRAEILRILEASPGDELLANLEHCLSLHATQSRNEQRCPRPRPKEDREGLEAVGPLALELARMLDGLSPSAWTRLERDFYRRESEFPKEGTRVSYCDVSIILRQLSAATEIHVPTGRPKNIGLRSLVGSLGRIWQKAHGEPPRRAYDPYGHKDSGPFLRFVDVCLRLLPEDVRPDRTPAGLIREVCDEMKRRGRNREEAVSASEESAPAAASKPGVSRPSPPGRVFNSSLTAKHLLMERTRNRTRQNESPEEPD